MKIFFSFKEAAQHVKHGAFFISYRGVVVPFWWNLTNHHNWVFFTPGRCLRRKPIPIFQRSSYAKEVLANMVSLFDPTLMMNKELSIAWFVGNQRYYYGDLVAELIVKMTKEFRVNGENCLIYGTSAGGIPAIKIGARLDSSTVYCSNAQTSCERYIPRFYAQMLSTCFPKLDSNEASLKYKNRFSCFMDDGNFHLYLTQNTQDYLHYENHFIPYVEHFNISEKQHQASFFTYFYDNGHSTLPRELELSIINSFRAGEPLELPSMFVAVDNRQQVL